MKTLKSILAITFISGILTSCSSTKQTSTFKKDFKLETIEFDVKDHKVKDLLITHINKTKFKRGQPIKKSTFHKERIRIVKLIRENNNPDFSIDKISFEIDTTLSKNKFSVKTIIQN
ncbi:hypothetical protein [Lacinutrix salivirga]